jgi:hypothetical protein
VGIRRWLRRIERSSRESADTMVLLDTETGEQFEAPRDAFLRMLASLGDEEPEPQIAPLVDRLDRLVLRDTGERFWFAPTRLMNSEESYED